MFLDPLIVSFVVVLAIELVVHMASFVGMRVRNEGADEKDPQLGRKFVLNLLLHYAILLVLGGFTLSACDLVDNLLFPWQQRQNMQVNNPFAPPGVAPPVRPSVWSENQRVAAALVVSGVLYLTVFWMVIQFGTNSRAFPRVGRAFAMTRFALGGVIVMAATTVFLVLLFQKGTTDVKAMSYVLGFATVWGPVSLGHLIWVLGRCKKDNPKAASKEQREWEEQRRRQRPERDEED